MKKFAGNFSVALLLVVYLAAFAGFKIHECACDHTVELLSVLADDDCEQVHHDDHHHHSHHAETEEPEGLQISESDCCHNSVHILFSEQIVDGDNAQDGICTASQSIWQPDFKALCVAFGWNSFKYTAAAALSGRSMLALYSVIRA